MVGRVCAQVSKVNPKLLTLEAFMEMCAKAGKGLTVKLIRKTIAFLDGEEDPGVIMGPVVKQCICPSISTVHINCPWHGAEAEENFPHMGRFTPPIVVNPPNPFVSKVTDVKDEDDHG